MKTVRKRNWKSFFGSITFLILSLLFFSEAGAQSTVIADVVVFDTPILFNRLGAQSPNWITYALKRDVVAITGTVPGPGNAQMRKDKRIRPLVLRVNEGDTLQVNFENWLTAAANPNNPINNASPFLALNDQVAGRFAGFHVRGLQLFGSTASDASNVGQNISRPRTRRSRTVPRPAASGIRSTIGTKRPNTTGPRSSRRPR